MLIINNNDESTKLLLNARLISDYSYYLLSTSSRRLVITSVMADLLFHILNDRNPKNRRDRFCNLLKSQ